MPRSAEIKDTSWKCPECGTGNDVMYDNCSKCDIEVELVNAKQDRIYLKKQHCWKRCEKCIAQYVCSVDILPGEKECKQTMKAFDLKGLDKSGDELKELCDIEGNLKKNKNGIVEVIADMDAVDKQCCDQNFGIIGDRIAKWTDKLRALIGKAEK